MYLYIDFVLWFVYYVYFEYELRIIIKCSVGHRYYPFGSLKFNHTHYRLSDYTCNSDYISLSTTLQTYRVRLAQSVACPPLAR